MVRSSQTTSSDIALIEEIIQTILTSKESVTKDILDSYNLNEQQSLEVVKELQKVQKRVVDAILSLKGNTVEANTNNTSNLGLAHNRNGSSAVKEQKGKDQILASFSLAFNTAVDKLDTTKALQYLMCLKKIKDQDISEVFKDRETMIILSGCKRYCEQSSSESGAPNLSRIQKEIKSLVGSLNFEVAETALEELAVQMQEA